MRIITSGDKYIDIDGLACAIAYKEYLSLIDKNSIVVFSPPFNQSISETILSWDFSYNKKIPSGVNKEDVKYVIMDVSDPDHFDAIVEEDKVYEIFDHHFGYEDKWEEKLGDRAVIEPVGAAVTLVFELFEKDDLLGKLKPEVANLIYTAIISNSLNLNAQITKERDKKAIKLLRSFTDLPKDWIVKYYTEIEKYRLKNPIEAIENDTKFQRIKGKSYAIGQAELWDGKPFIFNYKTEIMNSLKRTGHDYSFLTVASISEGKNYIVTTDKEMQESLEKNIDAEFDGDLGQTDKLWLRKEIIRELMK